MSLNQKTCVPCQGGIPPLTEEEIQRFLSQLNDWNVVDNHHLEKTYTFPNFVEALALTNKIGEIAESEGHHPDLYLTWGKLIVKIWTHKIDGLHENDFILAAKCDEAAS